MNIPRWLAELLPQYLDIDDCINAGFLTKRMLNSRCAHITFDKYCSIPHGTLSDANAITALALLDRYPSYLDQDLDYFLVHYPPSSARAIFNKRFQHATGSTLRRCLYQHNRVPHDITKRIVIHLVETALVNDPFIVSFILAEYNLIELLPRVIEIVMIRRLYHSYIEHFNLAWYNLGKKYYSVGASALLNYLDTLKDAQIPILVKNVVISGSELVEILRDHPRSAAGVNELEMKSTEVTHNDATTTRSYSDLTVSWLLTYLYHYKDAEIPDFVKSVFGSNRALDDVMRIHPRSASIMRQLEEEQHNIGHNETTPD